MWLEFRRVLFRSNVSPEQEKERLEEIQEHYKTIMENEDLRKQFDYIVYNNYDKESEEKIINLVKEIMEN